VHVAVWVESLGGEFAPSNVERWLAAVRVL
jgi:hypothetical protein